MSGHQLQQRVGIGCFADDVEAFVGEQAHDARTHERGIVGDDHTARRDVGQRRPRQARELDRARRIPSAPPRRSDRTRRRCACRSACARCRSRGSGLARPARRFDARARPRHRRRLRRRRRRRRRPRRRCSRRGASTPAPARRSTHSTSCCNAIAARAPSYDDSNRAMTPSPSVLATRPPWRSTTVAHEPEVRGDRQRCRHRRRAREHLGRGCNVGDENRRGTRHHSSVRSPGGSRPYR